MNRRKLYEEYQMSKEELIQKVTLDITLGTGLLHRLYSSGILSILSRFYDEVYKDGYEDGGQEGYEKGYDKGYDEGYELRDGYDKGYL